MLKKYSKTLTMLMGAFMLFTISMNANSTAQAGTSETLGYDIEMASDQSMVLPASTAYQSGRRVGRVVGAAVGRVAFIATIGYELATNYFRGGDTPTDEINNLMPGEDLSVFDQ